MSKNKTCYCCDKDMTSVDHVPPKCFFPEIKDRSDSADFRKNLITVPSCDEHNLQTSKDDEYLLAVIVTHFENNAIAQEHFTSKLSRSFRRNPRLAQRLAGSSTEVTVDGTKGAILNAESKRMNDGFTKIAKGIYFHEYKDKLTEPLMIVSPSILQPNKWQKNKDEAMLKTVSMILSNVVKRGDNPEVFSYQSFRASNPRITIIRLVFYEAFEIFVFSGKAISDAHATKLSQLR